MPDLKIDDSLVMHIEDDCFVAPWLLPQTVLLVHGIGGCAEEWFAWVPPLAGDYRVIRVDLRGWGRSTVPGPDYPWSMHNFATDLKAMLDALGIGKVHFVGTKLGGRIALHFARAWPERLASMTLICTPMTISDQPNDSRSARPTVAGGRQGVADWARRTMRERLGDVSPDMYGWWLDLYSAADPHAIAGVYDLAWQTDEFGMLDDVTVPTLIIDSEAITPAVQTRGWVKRIPGAELVMIAVGPGIGRQISASMPAQCVAAFRKFIDKLAA